MTTTTSRRAILAGIASAAASTRPARSRRGQVYRAYAGASGVRPNSNRPVVEAASSD
jgi:hypothetical protein